MSIFPNRICKLKCKKCGYTKDCFKSLVSPSMRLAKVIGVRCPGCNLKCPECGSKMTRRERFILSS